MREPLAAAGHAGRQGQQARWRCIAKVQIAVGIVFHQQHLVLDGQLQHLLAALQRERGTARIAERGNQIDQLGLVLDDQLFERIGLHAFAVDRRADDFRAIEAKALDGREEGRAFDDHLVAGVDHGLADQVQRLLAAGGHDHLLGSHILGPLGRHEGR